MTLSVESLPGGIGARIEFGPGREAKSLSESEKAALREAFARHSVLLVRGLTFDSESLLAWTRVLGEPDIHPVESIRLPGQPEIIEIVHTPETLPADGQPGGPDEIVGELGWHADLMFTPVPSLGALLVALEVPEKGGETAFIDTALAYDALDEATQQALVGRDGIYQFKATLFRARSRDVDEEQFSEVRHPLVRYVPGTRTPALNVSPATLRIDGLDEVESERMLAMINAHTIQNRFSYVHRWQAGDLVLFNNTRTLHTAFGHERQFRRILHRTTLKGRAAEAVAS